MRLPYLNREDLPPDAQQTYDRIAGTRGSVLNVFRTLANSPGALKVVSNVGAFIRYESSIDPVVRELSILMVAKKTKCQYEWTQHMRVARQIGIPERLLQAAGSGELAAEAGKLGVAARFVDALLDEVDVDEELFQEVVSAFGESTTIELATLVGYYRLLAGILNACKVELEAGVSPVPF